ncbi:hypothetical protein [uncultured Tolumonas sp.]|uniref:hypothetical protein n=1 Tax=uncultured Tolumonas sp. TaxID=263765 RepID=UPI002A0A6BE7|nr:hypothetical protein [uncultured Tolumonas sp.]
MLLENFKEVAPDATDHRVSLLGYAFIFGSNTLDENGCMQIEMTANHPLKKGGFKSKKQTSNLLFKFCPFCSKPYKEGA